MKIIIVPTLQQKYSDLFTRDAQEAVGKIKALYLPIILAAGKSLGIDPEFIMGFMIVENTKLDPKAVSPGQAYGLLQLQVPTAYQAIKDQAPVIAGPQSAIIQKYVPGLLKFNGFIGSLDEYREKIKDALLIPEFNIWVGTMYLAQLFKKTIKKTGDLRLDHVIVQYNAGIGNYSKYVLNKGLATVDTATLVKNFPFTETNNYIMKLLGIDGAMMAVIRARK